MFVIQSVLRPRARSLSLVLACLTVGACSEGTTEPEWMPGPGESTTGDSQSATTTAGPSGTTGSDSPSTTTGDMGTTTGMAMPTTGMETPTTGMGMPTTGMGMPTTGMEMPDGGTAGEADAGDLTDGATDSDGAVDEDAGVDPDGGAPDASDTDAALDGGDETDGEVPGDGGAMTDAETDAMVDGEVPDATPEDDGGEQEPDWSTREDLGEGDGSDVVTIGDSWMSNSLFTGDAIEGALDRAGTDYRNYAAQGVMLLERNFFGAPIPTQFEAALRADDDIKTVLMTGGGNDVIQSPELEQSCAEGGELCQQKLEEIADALEELWADMAAAGVQDVVYVAYSSDAGSAGDSASTDASGVGERCENAPLNCHILQTTELVDGDLIADGIHPARAANNRMAEALLELMEERKMRR